MWLGGFTGCPDNMSVTLRLLSYAGNHLPSKLLADGPTDPLAIPDITLNAMTSIADVRASSSLKIRKTLN